MSYQKVDLTEKVLMKIAEDESLSSDTQVYLSVGQIRQLAEKLKEADSITDMFRSYVDNDASAACDMEYVKYALSAAGCDEKTAEKIGLGYIYE